jgi:hypothetical protein
LQGRRELRAGIPVIPACYQYEAETRLLDQVKSTSGRR